MTKHPLRPQQHQNQQRQRKNHEPQLIKIELLLPDLPPRKTVGPGQFAFGDGDLVRDVLEGARWHDVAVTPLDQPCAFPAETLDRYITGVGPVGLALREADEALRARVLAAARQAFTPFVDGDMVRFTAACWLITARA